VQKTEEKKETPAQEKTEEAVPAQEVNEDETF